MKLLVALEDTLAGNEIGRYLSARGHDVTLASCAGDAAESIASAAPPAMVLVGGSIAWRALVLSSCPEGHDSLRP